MTMGSRVDTRGCQAGPTQNKMNVICGRGNARQRGSEHIEVLKSNHSQGSEHRESRDGRARPGVGNSGNQSMSTPHWSSKCRSPLDDNKFPFNRIYLKFLFLFLAATHTQLHLHLYYSPSLTLSLSLTTCRTSPWLLWFLQQSRGTCSKFSFSFSFLLFLTISRRFFVGVVENFHLLYVIFFCNFCDFNFILIFA